MVFESVYFDNTIFSHFTINFIFMILLTNFVLLLYANSANHSNGFHRDKAKSLEGQAKSEHYRTDKSWYRSKARIKTAVTIAVTAAIACGGRRRRGQRAFQFEQVLVASAFPSSARQRQRDRDTCHGGDDDRLRCSHDGTAPTIRKKYA